MLNKLLNKISELEANALIKRAEKIEKHGWTYNSEKDENGNTLVVVKDENGEIVGKY